MFGLGYGFGGVGASRRHRASGGTPTPSPIASGTLTLAAIPAYEDKRIYQRSTTSGGGQGKGTGAIALAISGALAGTINARILSDNLTTVLQVLPDIVIANGQSVITVPGVDARYGWFHVELRDSSGVWQRMTYKCGMGALFGMAGQSLVVRTMGRRDSSSVTYANLAGGALVANPCSAVLIYYSETTGYTPAAATAPWQTPGDWGDNNGPNSLGIGQLCNQLIGELGINVGIVGAAVGGTDIGQWITGGTHATKLTSLLARVGAFEGFFWGQGHGNSAFGFPPKVYQGALDQLFAMISSFNSLGSYAKYIWTIPTTRSSQWGTPYTYNRVDHGAELWCQANGGYHIFSPHIAQLDGIHQTQSRTGAMRLADDMFRGARAYYRGNQSHLGPQLLAVSRVGTAVTFTFSDVGQTSLVQQGDFGKRIHVFPQGRVDRATNDNNRFPFVPGSFTPTSATSATATLANDPGDGHVLDVWVNWLNGPSYASDTSYPESNNLYDNRTDGDGITYGRPIQRNFTPRVCLAPSPGGTVNAPPGGYQAAVSPFSMTETGTTYGASYDAAFGNEMTGGTALCGTNRGAAFYPVTAEGWFTCPAIPASTKVLFGAFGNGAYVAITSAGKINVPGIGTGSTTLVAGCRYHVAAQFGPGGKSVYLTRLTDAAGAPITPIIVRELFVAGAATMVLGATTYGLRNLAGSFSLAGGGVDTWAIFNAERYAGTTYTCPTAPFTGAETDIVALYLCNADARDLIAA